ncbi:6971_t:CDS:2 [Dentiscutata erythropus]|uniref:6971_t:CDS:1 n=1 Tax=Dentiscutata erythropus TaxID=1348616 RepID=A0A9N9F3T4_9GLOM|nr:6971_t:CDS:2 [Dentiscutata erythropus]
MQSKGFLVDKVYDSGKGLLRAFLINDPRSIKLQNSKRNNLELTRYQNISSQSWNEFILGARHKLILWTHPPDRLIPTDLDY